MMKNWIGIVAAAILVAACAVPGRPDPQSVQIEGAPGKAVIYLVRTIPDLSYVPAAVSLNDQLLGTTYAGTYFRIEVPAGRHRFAGYGVDAGRLTLDVQADRIYFVQQSVAGHARSPTSLSSSYRLIDEARARSAMAGAQRMG